uniref:hypothetical protein n=1 Tax=Brevibacterium siliguriense TaxID=1136497 RepID=UPI00269BFD1B
MLAFNAGSAPEAEKRMAEAFEADSALAGLQRLRAATVAPQSLSTLGFSENDIPQAVELSLSAIPKNNPLTPTEDNLTMLLRAALEGLDPMEMS